MIQNTLYSHCHFTPGRARLVTHQRGHPGGLGQDGVVPRRHASQRRAAGPAEGPAEGVDVEPDPGERAAPLPEPPQRPGHPAAPAGQGDKGLRISRPGCRPAPQGLLLIIIIVAVVIAIGWADQQQDEDQVTRLHRRFRMQQLDAAWDSVSYQTQDFKNTWVFIGCFEMWCFHEIYQIPALDQNLRRSCRDYFNETREKYFSPLNLKLLCKKSCNECVIWATRSRGDQWCYFNKASIRDDAAHPWSTGLTNKPLDSSKTFWPKDTLERKKVLIQYFFFLFHFFLLSWWNSEHLKEISE